MKQETKELLEWIEKQINLAGTIVTDVSQPYWQKDREKALEFLNSLSDIENKLCYGGYILDANGKPCCDGDRVLFNGKNATLFWSKTYSRFFVRLENSAISNDCRSFFEKDIEKVE